LLHFSVSSRYCCRVLNDLDQWFAAEILPLEGLLVGYLTRVWPNPSDVPDLRQDIYVRVYESAQRSRPSSPKAFLFATARNLMTDRVRHSRVVSIESMTDFDHSNVLIDEVSPERHLGARQELHRLAAALDTLSDKCRNVVWLRRVEGLSQRDTAQRLGLDEGAVESQLSRGIRALAQAIFGSGESSEGQRGRTESAHESKRQ
jgi:RNA polymerase sigma factor (sigma-70 family)